VAHALPTVEVRLAYADVVSPTTAEAMAELPGPVVVVPAFLASGYHVRVDVPEQLAATGRDDVVVAAPFGPDPALIGVLLDRLEEAGARPGDTVVLAAAGSRDPVAQDDLTTAAALLTARVGHEVPVGYIAGGDPRVAAVVASSAPRGERVVVATWLLAPGAFHRWLADTGAAVVAAPLGEHPDVVGVAVARYRAAAPAEVAS
jgi:sirohydrochlorin ferrochelatase